MKNRYSKLLEEMTDEGRNAFRVIAAFLSAVIVVGSFIAFQTLRNPSWQLWTEMVAVGILLALTITALTFARRGRHEAAVWLTFVPWLIVLIVTSAMISGLGVVLLISAVTIISLIAGQTLPSRQATALAITGVTLGIVTLLVDLFIPTERIVIAGFQTVVYVLLAVLLPVFGYTIFRQFRNYSMRTKLMIGVISLAAVSVGILAFVNYTNARSNLEKSAGDNLKSIANSQADAISNFLRQETHLLQSFDLSKVVQDRVDQVNAAYGPDQAVNLQQIQLLDKQWRTADAANNNNAPIVSQALNSEVASELTEFQETFPENAEVFVTDKYGALVAATNRTSDYYQADEAWWQAAYNNGKGAVYFGQPEFDDSSKTFGIILAVPLVAHGTNEVTGVMRTTLKLDGMLNVLGAKLLNGTTHTDLYLPNNQTLAPEESIQVLRPSDPQALAYISALITDKTYDTFILDGVASVVSAAPVILKDSDETQAAIKNLNWLLIVDQSQADNLAPVTQQTRVILLIALLILVVAVVLSIFLAQTLTNPIVRLTAVASEIAGGNLAVQAQVDSKDEIGILATTFNKMSAQLKNTLDGLEQTVADRTKELESAREIMTKRAVELQSVAEISTQASVATSIDEMLQTVVDLTKSSYNLYHAHIYLLDATRTNLVLSAGAGEVGARMVREKRSIPLDHQRSLVARAARAGKGAISNDVTQEPDFLPNPLLPDTKSEMAIPISVGGSVLGILDIQADYINRFTDEDIALKTTLAQQVATSLENLRQYQISQKVARELGVVASVSTATATITDANHLLQEVVDRTKEAFNLYHVHIYLLNDAGDTLELAAGAGTVGKQMVSEGRQISLNSEKSLVARAARTRIGAVVNDVRADADFLPHPLLPETRSEQAVPMIVGDKVLGVLDVQSEQLNRFTEIDVNINTTLASQVAVALQNARTFSQAQGQTKRETMLNAIGQKIQSATSVEAVLQIAARELGRALDAPLTIAQLGMGIKEGGHGHGNGNDS